MSLYRLDRADGTPVTHWGRDYLARNAGQARQRARNEADACGQDVLVTRIYGAGLMRPHYTARPNR